MNFALGVIVIVGVLVAIILGFIAISPDDIPEPRIVEMTEKPTVCTLEWDPMCGVDGETYGNSCALDVADIKLDYQGECTVKPIPETVKQISVNSHIMPKTAIVGDVLLVEVEFRDDDGIIIDHVNYDITVTQDTETILSELGSHRHPGKHPIHETTMLVKSPVEIKVIIQGLGHGDDITEPKGIESSITLTPEPKATPELETTMEMPAPGFHDVEEMIVESTPEPLTMIGIVTIPPGAAVPGCDDADECYLPYTVSVATGATVLWSNDDSAAHTVSSGTIDELTEIFDSGLFMAGDSFEFTFDTAGTYDYFCMVHPSDLDISQPHLEYLAGTYDYFCMVHPWMTGIVNVG